MSEWEGGVMEELEGRGARVGVRALMELYDGGSLVMWRVGMVKEGEGV